jgi:hypothetical protein
MRNPLPDSARSLLRVFRLLPLVLSIALIRPVYASSASVHCGTGQGTATTPDGSWRSTKLRKPTANDVVTWWSGRNIADEKKFPATRRQEQKMNIADNGTVLSRLWLGFDDLITGSLGSEAESKGTGYTQYVAPSGDNSAAGFFSYWNVYCRGVVGGGTGDPHFDARAMGQDPMCFRPEDLTDIDSTGSVDLFIPVSVGGSWDSKSGIGLHVSVETSSGIFDLLDVSLGDDGSSVLGGPLTPKFYFSPSITSGAPDSSAVPVSLSDIQSWLAAHTAADSLVTDLNLSIVLPGFAVPADTLSDGSSFWIHADSRVWCSGANHGFVVQPWSQTAEPPGGPGDFVVPYLAPVVDLTFDPLGVPGPGSTDGAVDLYGSNASGNWILLHQWDWNGGVTRSFNPLSGYDLYRVAGCSNGYPLTGSVSYPVANHAITPDTPMMAPDFALGGVDYTQSPFNPLLNGAPTVINLRPNLPLQMIPEYIGANHWADLPLDVMAQPDPSRPWLYIGNNPNAPLVGPTYVTLGLSGLFDALGNPVPQLPIQVQFMGPGPPLNLQVQAQNDGSGNIIVPPINLGSILSQPYQLVIGVPSLPAPQGANGTSPQVVPGYFSLTSLVVSGGLQQVTTGVADDSHPPATLALAAPAPNPCVSGTTIDFTLPRPGKVEAQIFDVRGALVRTLENGEVAGGTHRLDWDMRDDDRRPVADGLYFARLRALGRTLSRSIIVLR